MSAVLVALLVTVLLARRLPVERLHPVQAAGVPGTPADVVLLAAG